MADKELEIEFKTLSTEFKDLKTLTEKLYKKYEKLENKYEKCLSRKEKASFKCKICDEECDTVKDLQEHKTEKHANVEVFKCEDCEKSLRVRRNEMTM